MNHKQNKLDNINSVATAICNLATGLHLLNGVELPEAVSMIHNSFFDLEYEEDFEFDWRDTFEPYKAICYLNGLDPSSLYGDFPNDPALLYALMVFEKVRIEIECRGALLDDYFRMKDLYNVLLSFYEAHGTDDLNYEDKAHEILGLIRDSNVVDNLSTASSNDYVFFHASSLGFDGNGEIKYMVKPRELSSNVIGNVIINRKQRSARWESKYAINNLSKQLIDLVSRNLFARIKASPTKDKLPSHGLVALPCDDGLSVLEDELREMSQKATNEIIRRIRQRIKGYKPVDISYLGLVPRRKRSSRDNAYVFNITIPKKVADKIKLEDMYWDVEDYISTDISVDVREVMAEFLHSDVGYNVHTNVDFV